MPLGTPLRRMPIPEDVGDLLADLLGKPTAVSKARAFDFDDEESASVTPVPAPSPEPAETRPPAAFLAPAAIAAASIPETAARVPASSPPPAVDAPVETSANAMAAADAALVDARTSQAVGGDAAYVEPEVVPPEAAQPAVDVVASLGTGVEPVSDSDIASTPPGVSEPAAIDMEPAHAAPGLFDALPGTAPAADSSPAEAAAEATARIALVPDAPEEDEAAGMPGVDHGDDHARGRPNDA